MAGGREQHHAGRCCCCRPCLPGAPSQSAAPPLRRQWRPLQSASRRLHAAENVQGVVVEWRASGERCASHRATQPQCSSSCRSAAMFWWHATRPPSACAMRKRMPAFTIAMSSSRRCAYTGVKGRGLCASTWGAVVAAALPSRIPLCYVQLALPSPQLNPHINPTLDAHFTKSSEIHQPNPTTNGSTNEPMRLPPA